MSYESSMTPSHTPFGCMHVYRFVVIPMGVTVFFVVLKARKSIRKTLQMVKYYLKNHCVTNFPRDGCAYTCVFKENSLCYRDLNDFGPKGRVFDIAWIFLIDFFESR